MTAQGEVKVAVPNKLNGIGVLTSVLTIEKEIIILNNANNFSLFILCQ